MVTDPGASQVDDRVDAAEGGRVEAPGARIPADLTRAGMPSHDAHALVAGRREVFEKG